MFLLSLLQTISDDIISNSSLITIDDKSSAILSKGYVISLAILLLVNVLVMILNFALDRFKHRKDNHNHKVHIIAQKGIEVESAVYMYFQKMAAYQPGDEHILLDSILELDSFLNCNRIYIEKKFLSYAVDFLDYFKKIQHKMVLKDIKKEEAFFDKLSKAFYGE